MNYGGMDIQDAVRAIINEELPDLDINKFARISLRMADYLDQYYINTWTRSEIGDVLKEEARKVKGAERHSGYSVDRVMDMMDRDFDATVGINWETLRNCCRAVVAQCA